MDLTIKPKSFERMAHQQYQYSRFDTVLRQCCQGNVNVLLIETTFVDEEKDTTIRQRSAQENDFKLYSKGILKKQHSIFSV